MGSTDFLEFCLLFLHFKNFIKNLGRFRPRLTQRGAKPTEIFVPSEKADHQSRPLELTVRANFVSDRLRRPFKPTARADRSC